MAVHDVDITLPTRELGRADAVFDVKADGVTLGALHISKGAVVWFPSGTTYGYKLGWGRFDELMREQGRRREAR
jgi:hypothetical protein